MDQIDILHAELDRLEDLKDNYLKEYELAYERMKQAENILTLALNLRMYGEVPSERWKDFDKLCEQWLRDVAEIEPVVTTDIREKAADVLVKHQRTGSSSCGCGPLPLGSSHPVHQVDRLIAAGVIRTSVGTGPTESKKGQ